MTTIGLVADTHLPRFGRRMPRALIDGLVAARVERILHLGDHTASFVVDALGDIAPVDAVAGNNDPPELVERYGTRRIVDVAGVLIGLTHGHLGPGRNTPDRARRTFVGDGVSIVAFGHSHIPMCESIDGLWLVNPGSPTDRRRQSAWSFGLIELDSGVIRPRIVTFADRVP